MTGVKYSLIPKLLTLLHLHLTLNRLIIKGTKSVRAVKENKQKQNRADTRQPLNCPPKALQEEPPPGPRGATVARLTPDQKVACSNHVGVKVLFSLAPRDKFGSEPNCLSAGSQQKIFSYLFFSPERLLVTHSAIDRH